MGAPIVLLEDYHSLSQWHAHFVPIATDSWDPRRHQGLWRRTQSPINARESGWRTPEDSRRRMVHFDYKFAVAHSGGASAQIVMESCYVWLHVTLPIDELAAYERLFHRGLTNNRWMPWRSGVLDVPE